MRLTLFIWIAIGVALGGIVGAPVYHLFAGAGIGVAFGIALSLATRQSSERR